MTKITKNGYQNISKVSEISIFLILFIILFVQFFSRYVLNDSPVWTEEIARYLLAILAFVGGISCVRNNSHIYLEFIFRMVSSKIGKIFIITSSVLSVFFYFYSSYLAMVLSDKISFQRMISMDLPKNIVYYVIAACLFIMGLYSLIRLIKAVITKKEDICEVMLCESEEK